jgi:hypothetical protein
MDPGFRRDDGGVGVVGPASPAYRTSVTKL